MRKHLIMTVSALALALPMSALAQTAQEPGAMGQTGTTGLGGAAEQTRQLGQAPWQASALMGAQVVDNQGQQVGTISNFTISEDGQIEDVMLSAAGQAGAQPMRVQFSELTFEQGTGFTVDKSAQELRQQSQQ